MLKAILVLTIVTAVGDPAHPPAVIPVTDLATCEALAKAGVEALAAAHEERSMPSRLAGSGFTAARDNAGVWTIRFERASRADPKVGEPASARMIRGACREAKP
jgi:hypothetical protein